MNYFEVLAWAKLKCHSTWNFTVSAFKAALNTKLAQLMSWTVNHCYFTRLIYTIYEAIFALSSLLLLVLHSRPWVSIGCRPPGGRGRCGGVFYYSFIHVMMEMKIHWAAGRSKGRDDRFFGCCRPIKRTWTSAKWISFRIERNREKKATKMNEMAVERSSWRFARLIDFNVQNSKVHLSVFMAEQCSKLTYRF